MDALTVVIPTRDRPERLKVAVESALGQTHPDTAVLVVDDGSDPAVELPDHPRLAVVRHLRPRGVAAARNLGVSLASTRLVAFLDDDDRLRPQMAERSIEALATATAPPPVGVLSALVVVRPDGREDEVRVPPPLRERGAHFSLEPIEPGYSYFGKQTLVVSREVLLGIAGFDERFGSRVTTEMFWRLNPLCSIVGIPDVTYELHRHPDPRISTDRGLRQRSFSRLVATHRDLLRSHPDGYAALLAQHARVSLDTRQPLAVIKAGVRHARVAPGRTFGAAAAVVRHRLARS